MAVDASAVARVLGLSVEFVDLRGDSVLYLPQRIAVFAQGASASTYSTKKRRILSASEAGTLYGFGSPIHLIARELFPVNGDGVGTIPVTVYPLEDDYDAGTPSAGSITPGGTKTKKTTHKVRIGGVWSKAFTIDTTDSVATQCDNMVAAINAVLEMPVIATDGTTTVNLASKWAGESANGIVIEVPTIDNADDFGDLLGSTFTVVDMAGGAANPALDDALAQVGNVWETMLLNAMNADDETTLDALQTYGVGRWDSLVNKPCVAFVGTTEVSEATATAITDTRTDDYINSQVPCPGSPNLPFVVAARALARIARQANNNPPTDYGAKRLDTLIAGDDGDQWDYATRDAAVKAGSSTVEVVDGVITLGDVVTMYHPSGEEPPAFRYVVDIVRLQNILYNYHLEFGSEEWAAAPLIPAGQATNNPNAKRTTDVIAASASIIDGLGEAAIISDPATAKKNQTATIDSQNPKRVNLTVPVQLSGNTNVKDIGIKFGFFFGSAAAA